MTLEQVAWEWPLNEKSVVWVVGAGTGATIRRLAGLFDPHIWAFEPLTKRARYLAKQFRDNPKVRLVPNGLGEKTGVFPMARIDGTYATFIVNGKWRDIAPGEGRLVEVGLWMDLYDVPHVDFCHMNCEGYEFILLPHLMDSGLIERFQGLMIQFHPHHHDISAEEFETLKARLDETHNRKWDFGHQWVAWELK